MTECPSCNYKNPSMVRQCTVCGRSMNRPRRNPASTVYPVDHNLHTTMVRPKMAVFDIDDTLYNSSGRERNARRAGVGPSTPYSGDRKASDYPKGKKAFMDFFNSPKQFRADTITPGAVEYVDSLIQKGYVIAYLTGRPEIHINATMEHLKESGFPIFNDQSSKPLVFMKPNKKRKTPEYKFKVMRDLQQYYDIDYFFDDLKDNRDKAFQLGVIGVYDLRDHLGVKSNPSYHEDVAKAVDLGFIVPKGYREAAGCLVQRASDNKILFLRRSKKETSKHGLYEFPGGKLEKGETPKEAALIETKEEAGLEVKIIRRLQSHVDHTMKKVYHCFLAAPKKGARVKLSEEHDAHKWASLGKKWQKTKLSHHARFMLNQLAGDGALPNPLPQPKKKGKRKEPAKVYVKRMMGNTKMRAEFPDRSQRYAVTINLVEKHYGKRGLNSIGAKPNPKSTVLPIMSGEPSGKHTKLGAVFAEVVIGRNIVKDVGEVVQGIYRGLIGGRTSMAEKRLAMGVASMQKELSDRTKALGGNAVCNLKIDYEMIQGTATITIIATADAIKMARPPKRNPRKPLDGMEDDKKVTKAKKQYKKFHGGKDPENIEKKMIDVGDVWYSLGPCWSIGYMSPKETGDDEQKYIHHTNEDSKDGNFPMMYATMPESGQPMIVITGGSMKIGMRDGLAWLID